MEVANPVTPPPKSIATNARADSSFAVARICIFLLGAGESTRRDA